MRTVVSAYAASPAHARWDPVFEAAFLTGVAGLDGVDALEIPWLGRLHPHDDDWFLTHLPATGLIVTALPWTVARAAASPVYGLASDDPDGRAAAIADLARLHGDIQRLPIAPSVVLLHTAPRGGAGSAAGLRSSLATVGSWDWRGAALAIEHCDAPAPGRPFEKGFLPLADELAAITALADDGDRRFGVWLNWGRSAIELRDPAAITRQIAETAATGRLLGLSFSGAAATPGPYGPAWTDAHLPLADADPASGSLLTTALADEARRAAGDIPWHGLKVSRRPADTTVADVLATVAANLEAARGAVTASVR
jgi:hypothetical protein